MADEPTNELTGTPRDLFAALQRHFREQAVRADGLEKTHKAWAPIVLEEVPRLKRELDVTQTTLAELRREQAHMLAALAEKADALTAAERWTQEAEARAAAAEKRMAEMLDHPDVKAAELARAQAALEAAQARVQAIVPAEPQVSITDPPKVEALVPASA